MKKNNFIKKALYVSLVVALLTILTLIIMFIFFNATYIKLLGSNEEKCWLGLAKEQCGENNVMKVGDNFLYTSLDGGDFVKTTGFICKGYSSINIIEETNLEECKNV
jgi:hypothetical protein